ncbi:putative nuclease with RNAse H fold [Evansella vedderi]|uniref:Nuclease with RNAse H fold n=1 Tax=Evansella vedderi TaxID=38282 RepID=A0ABT9ZQE9_9BACI|nr:DUF429 domain-containing protein [Evansella vedderi]MDQ0253429.1 putative nuclease with RNAse H fold [Evansella vedderi]
MAFDKVIAIGWDVGGWMGSNHGVAICQWDKTSKKISWLGKPTETSITHNSLMSLEQLIQQVDPSFDLDHSSRSNTLVVIGVDAPLGYPMAFTKLLNGETPPIVKPQKEIHNPLAYRRTDQEIHNVFGKKPLSAVFDRIGNNATLAILHTRLWEKDNDFIVYPFRERTFKDNRIIIEVYPALVKERRNAEVSEELRQYMPAGIEPGTDAYDASICALYAIAYGTNGTLLPKLVEPPIHLAEESKEEGWIYYMINRGEE